MGVRESKVVQRIDILENSLSISRRRCRNSLRLFSATAMIVTNIDSSTIHPVTIKTFLAISTYTNTRKIRKVNRGNSSIIRKPIFTTT